MYLRMANDETTRQNETIINIPSIGKYYGTCREETEFANYPVKFSNVNN